MATYTEYNTSYSGSDISIAMLAPDGNYVPCGDIQTITVSEHTDRGVLRRLGRRGMAGYTNGPRTIAGSMIFTVLGNSPLASVLFVQRSEEQYFKMTQLPPMNFVIDLGTEYTGYTGAAEYEARTLRSALIGVVFTDIGVIYSIEDIKTELTATYIAYDYYPLQPESFFGNDIPREDYTNAGGRVDQVASYLRGL